MKLIECPATGELVCRPGEECVTVMTFGGCYVEDAILEELLEIDEDNAEASQHELGSAPASSTTLLDGDDGNAEVSQHELGTAPPSSTTDASQEAMRRY